MKLKPTKNHIKVGYLISYDYELLYTSLEQVYPYADKIFLALDIDRKTWSGQSLLIPPSFFDRISALDYEKKIHLYEDTFYIPELSPMECETRERNMLLKQMGKGWLIQLDVDEYIYEFKQIAAFLKDKSYLLWFPSLTAITFSGKLVTLFKSDANGYFYIDNGEQYNFITNYPSYTIARTNKKLVRFNLGTQTIHQSWARTENEIVTKINNWGHKNDFNAENFIQFWKEINIDNFESFNNFHPLNPKKWDRLYFIQSPTIQSFIGEYQAKHPQKVNHFTPKDILRLIKHNIKNSNLFHRYKGI